MSLRIVAVAVFLALVARAGAAEDDSPNRRSIAQLTVAGQLLEKGDLAAARREFAKLAQMPGIPAHHVWEARQRIAQIERQQAGLPQWDPAASRTAVARFDRPGAVIHVAPQGRDVNDGSSDRPFATLERARDEIRALKKRGALPAGGVVVLIHGGEYPVVKTFALSAEDSGSPQAHIIYRAAPGEKPVFRGGVRLRDWTAVRDEALLKRVPEEARGKVIQADLKANGVTGVLPLKLGGFASGNGFVTHPAHELFFNGKAMHLARWPDESFVRIKDVVVKDGTKGYDRVGSKVGKFTYDGDRPARWTNEPDLLLYGYWFWDWADSYERVESIDAQAKVITLAAPLHRYGFSVGAPYYAVNALCELDQPGEWHLDRKTGTVLLYPPADAGNATIEFSTFADTMVRLDNVSHVRLEGITWDLGSADAIHIRGGENCLLAGCTIRRFAGNALEVSGTGHGVLSCDVSSMGRGGIIMNGGNRKTLAPGKLFVENCDIHELSRIDHTYTPAILLNGVGNRIAHNRIHDINSSAMRVEGNDHVIEFNDVFRVVLESDDQGGADMWGNATYRGNICRYNSWRDIGGHPKLGQAGIRLDDAISGTLIYGNIFVRASTGRTGFGAVQIHGGKDNIIDNNLFVEGIAAISLTPWQDQRWREFVGKALDDRAIDKAMYLHRYPELNSVLENANRNHIWRNVVVRCEFLRRDSKRNELIDNTVMKEGKLPAQLRADSPLLKRPGFAPIPVELIGLYADDYRNAEGAGR